MKRSIGLSEVLTDSIEGKESKQYQWKVNSTSHLDNSNLVNPSNPRMCRVRIHRQNARLSGSIALFCYLSGAVSW